jgi:hypothetical protein
MKINWHFVRVAEAWGYVQDERYIAKEHMDVWRDCFSFAQCEPGLYSYGNLLMLRQGIRGHGVPLFRTRCEYIRVRSVATSLSLKVLKRGTPHPLLCAKSWANGF